MGKSGVEPNDNSAVNAMWRNEPNRLAKAKEQARIARSLGDFLSAHSIMLSAYITELSGKSVERHRRVKFLFLATWHAFWMSRQLQRLNHNQLDVLLQFLLKLRSQVPVFNKVFDNDLIYGSSRGIARAVQRGKPHQIALAYMTYAEVAIAIQPLSKENTIDIVEIQIKAALRLEDRIRQEPKQPQGLRQFVRILRKAGEIYMKPLMWSMDNTSAAKAKSYLQRALDLAQGEADASDQVPKIEASLRKLV